jgi:hypothetical protein
MIDRLDYYHGAAILRLIEDPRCQRISKAEYGYLVNDDMVVYLKYSTKGHSPWHFTITADDMSRLARAVVARNRCVVGLVCGGDGVCAAPRASINQLITTTPAWVTAKRTFNGSYGLSGPEGKLKHKIAVNQWPSVVFEDNHE